LADEDLSNEEKYLIGFYEKVLDGLIYELFFPEDLHSHTINLLKYVEGARLPVLTEMPEKQRLSRLREIHERISDDRHPIRGCLESLRTLEVIRIIEGETDSGITSNKSQEKGE